MKTEAQRIYSEANILRYSKGGTAQALDLYKQVIADYPESPEAEYSHNQISIIESASATLAGKEAQKVAAHSSPSSSGASSTLKAFAWLELILGLLGGVLIMVSMKTMMGTGLGIALILQVCFFWAVMMVVAEMADNLVQIKKNTSGKKP